MNNFIVYCHTLIKDGRKYIGITCQKPQKRCNYGNGYLNTRFGNAIKKYGWNNFKHEILFSGLTEKEAIKKEIELIEKYKTTQHDFGFNISKGGKGTVGYKFTDEDKIKMKISHLGKKLTDKQKEKISIALKEYYKTHKVIRSEETKIKISKTKKGNSPAYNKGIPCKEETKEKIRIANLGKKQSEETKNKRAKSLSKKVCMYDINDNYIKTFESLTFAAKEIGSTNSKISECCRGKRKTTKGWKWRYAE